MCKLARTGAFGTTGGSHTQHVLLAGEGFVAKDLCLLEQYRIAVRSLHQSSAAR